MRYVQRSGFAAVAAATTIALCAALPTASTAKFCPAGTGPGIYCVKKPITSVKAPRKVPVGKGITITIHLRYQANLTVKFISPRHKVLQTFRHPHARNPVTIKTHRTTRPGNYRFTITAKVKGGIQVVKLKVRAK
jgi:hypothetical protein